jgi:transcriptional regulator GlxA family with amidase domain
MCRGDHAITRSFGFGQAELNVLDLAEMINSHRITPIAQNLEIVAFPGANLLDIAGPLQVFASANEAVPSPAYEISLVARETPVVTSSGLPLVTVPLPALAKPVDTVIVVGGGGVHAACTDKPLLAWLIGRARMARRVASVCTGAFLLGAAGLLDGKRAVTHWSDCDHLGRLFPKARVEMNAIFIRDGALWSSAGVTAGIDLSLAMVEDDIGHAAASRVARDLVVFLRRPGGQAQFSTVLGLQEREPRFDELHGWMAGHLDDDLSISALAERARMSERTLLRHYRAKMGMTPARAVEKMRVEAACQLLATTNDPVKRIARRCGFGSEETMRRSFVRQMAIAPHDYRARFASTVTTPVSKLGADARV